MDDNRFLASYELNEMSRYRIHNFSIVVVTFELVSLHIVKGNPVYFITICLLYNSQATTLNYEELYLCFMFGAILSERLSIHSV